MSNSSNISKTAIICENYYDNYDTGRPAICLSTQKENVLIQMLPL